MVRPGTVEVHPLPDQVHETKMALQRMGGMKPTI